MNSLCLNPLFLRILYLSGVFFNILRFVVPIILIIRVILDVYKQVINPNDEEGKKHIKNRVIASIIVFLIPTVVEVFFSIIEGVTGNNYSDLAVCREFANLEYIEVLENDMDQINTDEYNKEKRNNLSSYEQIVEAVRNYVANNKVNNTNEDTNNTNQNNNNLPGTLNAYKYSNWNYYLYVPNNANSSSKKPLVVFLHGSGESGSDISKLDTHGFSKFINKKGKNYDAFILMPQLQSGEKWNTDTNRKKLMNLINKVVNENNINQAKISISGYSLGTVAMPNLVKENSNYFSAAVFIALCTDADSEVGYFKNIPTRLYYGSSDETCKKSYSLSFETKLKNINGNVQSIMKSANHSTIADVVLEDDGVINWMTSQVR